MTAVDSRAVRKAIVGWLDRAASDAGVETVAVDFDASKGRCGFGLGLLDALGSFLERPRPLLLVGLFSAEDLMRQPDHGDLQAFFQLSCVHYLRLPFDETSLEMAASRIKLAAIDQEKVAQLADVLVRLQMDALYSNVVHAIENVTATKFFNWVDTMGSVCTGRLNVEQLGRSKVPEQYEDRLSSAARSLSASIFALELRHAPASLVRLLKSEEAKLSEARDFARKLVLFERGRSVSPPEADEWGVAAEWGRTVLKIKSEVVKTLLPLCGRS